MLVNSRAEDGSLEERQEAGLCLLDRTSTQVVVYSPEKQVFSLFFRELFNIFLKQIKVMINDDG
ncbi:hypothetical protein DPMN_040733 [Dreissena polymorpha]|uniref:Uncharacterized protein n=1 Tax=Dreissena polymorpha TaxID=45954 RepID=A0A9D4CXA3_DREPO|nr:hypothetical protein DPMN_040733 [Dreissena polymorpha]